MIKQKGNHQKTTAEPGGGEEKAEPNMWDGGEGDKHTASERESEEAGTSGRCQTGPYGESLRKVLYEKGAESQ